MRRPNKQKRALTHHKQETLGRKSKVVERPRRMTNPYFLLVALPLLLVAAFLWQRSNLGGAGETKTTASIAVAGPANDESGENEPATSQQQPAARVVPSKAKIVREGVEIAFSIAPARGEGGPPATPEDDSAEIVFALKNTTTGELVAPESPPGVWIDIEKARQGEQDKDALTCQDKVRLYAQGSLGFRPDIDLNSYLILAMNTDATISVIDPLVGVTGVSQLYSMIYLKSRGEDWALSGDQKRLFVTMPEAGQVAVVDTDSFKVLKNIDAGSSPGRIALQPDGKYLWVGNDSGVAVIETTGLEAVAQTRTGAGPHEIAFSGDVVTRHMHSGEDHAAGQHETVISGKIGYAYVTNRKDGTLSIVDAQTLKKARDINVGKLPAGLDFSSVSNAIYVAGEDDGTVTVIDVFTHEVVNRITAKKGIGTLRFAPGGRWGFVVNGKSNVVDVIDTLTDSIVHSVEVGGEPDSISFTHGNAYIRATGTAEVSLIDLAQLGRPDRLAITKIIGGQRAPRDSPFGSMANSIFAIHEHGNHVLIANPADNYIYYYMEGMKAPMGGFQNYGRTPTAVNVVDRGIRQIVPGVYTAKVRLPKSGQYQVAFLLDSPRIVECFTFAAELNPAVADEGHSTSPSIQLLDEKKEVTVGERVTLRFALSDSLKNEPLSGVHDVQIVAALTSGLWSERYRAVPVGDGIYEVSLTIPRPGVYSLHFTIPSLKVTFNQLPSVTLSATAGGNPK